MAPPKSERGRRAVSIDPDTVEVLHAHRGEQLVRQVDLGDIYQDHGYVFAGPMGEPLDPQWLTDAWRRLTAKAGLVGVRLHDLRHFHASLLLREGINPKVVQERLGHSSVVITLDIYSHVMPGIQEQAALSFAEAMRNSASREPI